MNTVKGTVCSWANGRLLVIYSAPTHIGLPADAELRVAPSGLRVPTNGAAVNAIKTYVEQSWRGYLVEVKIVDGPDDTRRYAIITDYQDRNLGEELLRFAHRDTDWPIT